MWIGLRFRKGPLRVSVPLYRSQRRRDRAPARPKAQVYRHGTCTIAHRTLDAACRCDGVT